ncbi:NADH:ubiquinone oxidoreductase [candidate division MSBL1 archaeon SCGC-AAA382A20]|uniref:NADH:ubiquinone oxidoreductase n=1 Tax=candidate division MSBL1 archaeon SCGC-AAA382A20 TaxID=1698280 RepID=A0A133VI93_9EURY|nr:NADH:ubiquinone oxidoreductase [candidate division MSBL1 archaeon SCGC-AAA382A20]
MSDKPKAAFFDFAGCEGDQLQVVNLEEELLDLLEIVEVVSFREAMSEHSDDYDIAFVEGSATTPHAEERLKKIRENADIVVAIGSCATIGGINSIRNSQDYDEVQNRVYGDKADYFESWGKAKAVDAVIPVDYRVHGCPIDRDEFLHVVESLVMGKEPNIPNYPVCVECKLNENVCAFERDEFCLGPITRAGCDACCVNEGTRCWGCRGLIDDPNEDAHKEVLEEYGLTAEDIMKEFNLYFSWQQEARENQKEGEENE